MADAVGAHKKKRRRGRGGDNGGHTPATPVESSAKTSSHQSQQQRKSLLIQLSDDEPTWFKYGSHLPGRNATMAATMEVLPAKNKRNSPSPNPPSVVSKYRALGNEIYRTELQLASKSAGKTADDRWVEATIHRGTLKDRIAAMSVLASTDPVHKLYALDGLLQLAGCHIDDSSHHRQHPSHQQQQVQQRSKPNSRVAHMAAQAMEDLFLHSLLPKDRKLLTLDQRPLYQYENANGDKDKPKSLSPRLLLLWRVEEMIRDRYRSFVSQYLSRTLRDPGLDLDKKFCLRVASNLLRSAPEGEAQLLQLLVDKLGDPSRAVSSSASHELQKLLAEHPAMRTVVAREVQQLAHRPNLSARALYNCAVFLNQLALDSRPDGKALAVSLVATYFRLFDAIVDDRAKNLQDGEQLQSRLLSALLTGVNRARPFLSEQDRALGEHTDTLYRVAHTATPAARTQAFLLLFHVTVGTASEADVAPGGQQPRHSSSRDGEEESESRGKRRDRFYRALYSTLSDSAMLGGGKHQTLFFNLLYKSLKHDPDSIRALAFVKRIFATSLHCPSPVAAASIFLVNEIAKYHPNLTPCLAEVLDGADALRVLDPTKREPRGAIVLMGDKGEVATNTDGTKVGLWELSLFQHHYHPSVVKFARSVGDADSFSFSGDPLRDFGLQPFLDKFSYRNPKSAERLSSKYRKAGEQGTVGRRKETVESSRLSSIPVNDPSFAQQQEVDVQDEFFHKFFVERARRDELKGIVRHKAGSSSVENSEEAQQFLEEQNALDKAEDWDGAMRFEDWEREWGTDPEEEAFVDSLTQRIIEDSVGLHGPGELDGEDPDMEGWGDLQSEDDDADEDQSVQGEDQGTNTKLSTVSAEDDGFMDASTSASDNSDSENEGDLLDGEEAVTSFSRHGDSNEDEETNSSGDDSGDNDIDLLDQLDEEDIDNAQERDEELDRNDDESVKRKSNLKKQKARSTFAELEEYEDRINESWLALNRPAQEDAGKSEATDVADDWKRRKRRKR